jgi:hypothetical protein
MFIIIRQPLKLAKAQPMPPCLPFRYPSLLVEFSRREMNRATDLTFAQCLQWNSHGSNRPQRKTTGAKYPD